MLTLNISKTDIELLRYERYTYPCQLVQKRLHALYLKATTDLPHQQIAKIVGIHRDTFTRYIHCYNHEGLSGIYQVNYRGNTSELDKHKISLVTHFTENPPLSCTEAIAEIKRLTGLERSPTQVRKWLHKHGFKPMKAGQIPSKADGQKQEKFIEQ
ncbi:helix-turn-helix domain-containing protein, partial [uncultured Microscilla sp.]|uniref:helix-turn-helix domain-containing protein n=1 Tax=uncultured Microscilla sp. TaxID=432653 RepID=UPI002624E53C